MNRNNLYIIAFLCSLFLAGCTNEEYVEKKEQVVEGLPATVSLALNAIQMDKIQTRAGEALDNDGKVFDLMLFIIKGEEAKFVHFQNGLGSENTSTSITFSAESANDVQLYALANIEGSSYKLDKGESRFSVEDLKLITTKEALMNITATLEDKLISYSDGYVLMSGFLASLPTESASTISIAPGKNAIIDQKIFLKRVCSAITFEIKAGDGVTFKPKTWRVMSLPYTTNLFGSESDAPTEYFNMEKAENVSNAGQFTFYMSENRKNSDRKQSYDNRPKFAPQGSSYIILTGEYNGPAKKNSLGDETNNETVRANVTYTIFFGYVNEDVNNFVTRRNKKYKYTVTVTNVDKIIQEVIENEYDYPTGEGDIYYTSGTGRKIEQLDSHNGSFEIVFNREELKKGIDYNFSIKTPLTGNQWVEGGAKEVDDYTWVRFIKHENGEDVSYPGDEQSQTETVVKFVRDVKDAMNNELNDGSNNFFDAEGNAYYKVFVLEYYYGDDNWKKGINGENREMKILMKTQKQDPDQGNSSVTDANFYFTQKPIQCIYNLDNVDAAWGIEWVNESGRLPYYTSNGDYDFNRPSKVKPTNQYDGRANMIKELGSLVGQADSWSNEDISKYAYAACMSRNRDENGNGVIDGDEIKWYLPASNQYNDIWMGLEGIDQEAGLYPYFKEKYQKVHYASNTFKRNVFWSEEGASISEFGNANRVPGGKLEIRCARNLGRTYGVINPQEGDIPDLVVSKENEKYRLIEVKNLNTKSFRNKQIRNELGKHFEDEENNKLYKAYLVQKKTVATGRKLVEVNEKANNNNSPCDTENGWRLPNQREYTMFADRYDNTGIYITRTLYSFGRLSTGPGSYGANSSQGYNTNGYMYNGGHMGLSGPGSTDYNADIRCVRDIDPSEHSKFGF